MSSEVQRPLRPGDVVQVRPRAEILATLDDTGSLDGVPFMPEMLQYVGRRFRVSTRVERFCDTIDGPRSRRIRDTVYLGDLRCDGSGHGGCQAACRLYWKEAWLARVDAEHEGPSDVEADGDAGALERVARAATTRREPPNGDDGVRFRCQATDAPIASEPLRAFDLRQYVREVRVGNVGIRRLARVAVRAVVFMVGRTLRLIPPIPVESRPGGPAPEPLNLAVGDWVQIKSPEEIGRTLDERGKNKGLWFDWEMRPYCGGTYRVKERIERFIDERTGRMIEIKSDCFVLDGVVCSGDYSNVRWLCPRAIPSFWREAWLRRVDPPPWAVGSEPPTPRAG
jgi:hypothetical protein